MYDNLNTREGAQDGKPQHQCQATYNIEPKLSATPTADSRQPAAGLLCPLSTQPTILADPRLSCPLPWSSAPNRRK